ncbi:MAG: PKD domain-containing protein, partial [Bacteroidota bacterium]
PPPAPPNGINGPATVCPGDTLNFSVTPVPGATSYGWSVTGNDSIIAGVDSSIMTLVIDSASVGDTICVYLNDSCTSSPDTCFVYGINFPAPPGAITGDTLVCSSDTVQYSVAFVPGAVSYNWIPPKGSTILTGQGTNIVEIVMDSASGDVCLTLTDSCATSDTTCLAIEIDTMPTVANAGLDVTLCSGLATTLNGNVPAVGTGIWTLASGGGTIVDPTLPATGFTNIQVGSNELVWTITGEAGCPSFSDTVLVDASQSPTAMFSAPGSCDLDSTQLTDLSSGNGFALASWDWDVDGDAVADYTTATASHLYNTLGPKTIRLIVTNALGCSDTISQTSWVNPNPATAFTANDVCDEEVMTFTDNTTIVTGSVVSYLWNFGDLSGLDNNQNTLHLYNNPGVYNVQFTATSDSGCSITSTQPVEVYHNPLVDFTAPATCRNRTVAFSDHSAVTNSSLINWDWTFGDGLPNLGLQNPTHDYLNHGTYQVTLEVTSVQGCSSTLTKPIVIHPVPIPDYSTVAAACVGELVNFTDQSSIATGSVVKWDWFLDQGVWLSEKDPTYIYGDYGDFDVLLVAVSDQGCRDTLSQPIRINPIPVALFSVNDVCQDDPALIQDASTVAEGSILNRTWNLGDGATFGNQNFISHLYKDPGVYPIYLQVTSDAGCV